MMPEFPAAGARLPTVGAAVLKKSLFRVRLMKN